MSAVTRRHNQDEGLMNIPGLGENKHRPRKYQYDQQPFLWGKYCKPDLITRKYR